MNCNYCDKETEVVTGETIYPHIPQLRANYYHRCVPCSAYVGCHSGTATALGTLANKELRKARAALHNIFDPLWREGDITRRTAYSILAKEMKIHPAKCHIAMFDLDQCLDAYIICERMR